MPTLTVRTELHCHNVFSNFHVGAEEPPYDCNVSVRDQLEQARREGLDAIFVTNHNTLSGYDALRECRNSHEKFRHMAVYPAEEITTDTGAHVLAYGVCQEIPPGLPLDQILDAVRDQGAVSSAPHPFSIMDAVRQDAAKCDMIEVFNSNNVDTISNARAFQFAADHSMTGVAGSDSHVLSTVGRCVNLVDSQNNLDDMLRSMKRGRVTIGRSGYVSRSETMEHLRYKIRNSREYLTEYIDSHYPRSAWMLRLLLQAYDSRPDSILWTIFYRLGVYLMSRVSYKINRRGADPEFMKRRDLADMLRMAV